ncbi:hypothetical protein JAAARDRAFT_584841 [Jaapia argillacea MUCL 33604]|uniref:Nephrocystin 3-like N-terminal domain-containing protein n=1 Tax=Jaapia argillacea MUCL 33604 TaxID=933084 RepID=A0A067PHH7_9AGAM|nr:hypothetical protein JAAARDRAFT_584841 [Jaapia argillacea MUCL 33604]
MLSDSERALLELRLDPMPPSLPSQPCLPGTFQRIISVITSWLLEGEHQIFWLNGVAGSGKSTVASTIWEKSGEMGDRVRRGAFISFNRSEAESSNPRKAIATLAYQFSFLDDRIGAAIVNVLKAHPNIVERSLPEQFSRLIVGPLESIPGLERSGRIAAVLDGLDECSGSGEERQELLCVLSRGFGANLQFTKLLVTSRWEPDIEAAFNPETSILVCSKDLSYRSADDNVRRYIEYELADIGREDAIFHQQYQKIDAAARLT